MTAHFCLQAHRILMASSLTLLLLACPSPEEESPNWNTPSDDPFDYEVDTSVDYEIQVSEPHWVVPSNALPNTITPQASNNNVDITFFEDRLFMAWRSGPNHFASDQTVMHVVSSTDMGATWEEEAEIFMGTDMREPRLLNFEGRLQLLYFQAGTNFLAFEPVALWRVWREGLSLWGEPEIANDAGEVPWDVKVRRGVAYMSSYEGEHYSSNPDAFIDLLFKESRDGITWNKVNDKEYVYRGGVSEAAYEFDEEGNLWIVTRNEDGDDTGKGSHVCFAPASDISAWDCPDVCSKERYDSPEMFRHGKNIYLAARKDVGGPYGDDPSMADYSARPKGFALYEIDTQNREVIHLMDLPGVGDTAFPAIARTGAHTFLLANYTSPLDDPDVSWFDGQTSDRGTQIYLMDLSFSPQSP